VGEIRIISQDGDITMPVIEYEIIRTCQSAHPDYYRAWRDEIVKRAKNQPYNAQIIAQHGMSEPPSRKHIAECSECLTYLREHGQVCDAAERLLRDILSK